MKRGNRKRIKRNQRPKRRPKLKNYLIFTDAEKTEVNYFYGLKDFLPSEVRNKISIEVIKSESAEKLIEDAKRHIEEKGFIGYKDTWLIFDRDEVKGFDDIVRQAESNDFNVGWSNPCIGIWFLSYFGKNPNNINAKSCIDNFKKVFEKIVKKPYKKNDKEIYRLLRQFGDEEEAIRLSRNRYNDYLSDECKKPSNMNGATRVFELVEEIRQTEVN